MKNDVRFEVSSFLDQFYENEKIGSDDFLEAIKEKMRQLPDTEQREQFIAGIIEEASAIRDKIALHIREQELYKLRGDEL